MSDETRTTAPLPAQTGQPAPDDQTDTTAIEERLVNSALAALDVWSIYLGEQLGLYDAMTGGPSTAAALATEAGVHPRYVREWLEQQAVSGLVEVDDPSAAAEARRFALSPAHAQALTDRNSTAYLAPLMRMLVAAGTQMPALLEAYRTGGGVGWTTFGEQMRTAQADMNRPWFLQSIGTDWFPAAPDLHERLLGGARVADIGCGEGWSAIAMAHRYPTVHVDAYDTDEASVRAARAHVAAEGLEDRVQVRQVDAGAMSEAADYDVVTAFECIHDLPHPVDVLASMRRMVRPDGHVVVMDERVPEEFTGAGDDVERLMYGLSLLICLPDGMAHPGSVGTGTVMRPATLRGYALEAGFRELEVLPIDNDLWRFYRLQQ